METFSKAKKVLVVCDHFLGKRRGRKRKGVQFSKGQKESDMIDTCIIKVYAKNAGEK